MCFCTFLSIRFFNRMCYVLRSVLWNDCFTDYVCKPRSGKCPERQSDVQLTHHRLRPDNLTRHYRNFNWRSTNSFFVAHIGRKRVRVRNYSVSLYRSRGFRFCRLLLTPQRRLRWGTDKEEPGRVCKWQHGLPARGQTPVPVEWTFNRDDFYA